MTPNFARLAAPLLATFAIACGSSNHERGEPCDSSDNCASGLTCASGECRAPCNLGSDCPFGTGCTGGLCMPLAAGACGQPSDCRTPPDTCHTTQGAQCTSGRCAYPRAATPQCREPCSVSVDCDEPTACESPGTGRCVDGGCVYSAVVSGAACAQADSSGVCYDGRCVDCLTSADCDPRGFGRDLCFTGVCSNRVCAFTEIASCDREPIGTACEDDDDCRTGYCTDGVCCESRCEGVCLGCGGDGRCDEVPADDDACGVIDCDGLDSVCRNYHDLENNRCADLGQCAQPNSAACVSYNNASASTVCRPMAGDCDIVERCQQGECPADDVDPAGQTCVGDTPGASTGRCDGVAGACRVLPEVSYGARWFLEEPIVTINRQDAFDILPLAYSGSGNDIARVEGSGTGGGVAWPTTASTSIYCSDLHEVPLSPELAALTFEAVVTANNQSSDESTVMMLGPQANRAKLSIVRNDQDPPGRVTVRGTFGNSAAYYTWSTTLSPRAVLHLTIDGAQTAASMAMRLHVDGVEVPRQSTSTAAAFIALEETDELCIGNDQVGGSGAFLGTIWYGAIYLEVLSEDAIRDAAARLALADKP